jgi:hypothetical protein
MMVQRGLAYSLTISCRQRKLKGDECITLSKTILMGYTSSRYISFFNRGHCPFGMWWQECEKFNASNEVKPYLRRPHKVTGKLKECDNKTQEKPACFASRHSLAIKPTYQNQQ